MNGQPGKLEVVYGAGGAGGQGGHGGNGAAWTGTVQHVGQRLSPASSRGDGARVQFPSARFAYKMLEPLLDSRFAVQVTTYPEPRVRDATGRFGPAVTFDFHEDDWLPEMVRLLRDVTYPLSSVHGALAVKASRPHAYEGVLCDTKITEQTAVHVLDRVLGKPKGFFDAIDGGWRVGGQRFVAQVVKDQIEEFRNLCDRKLPFTTSG